MTRPETAPDPASLAVRIDRLEDRMRVLQERGSAAGLAVEAPSQSAPVTVKPPIENASQDLTEPVSEVSPDFPPLAVVPDEPMVEEAAAEPEVAQPSLTSFTLESVDGAWPAIMARVRDEAGMRRHALFREAKPVEIDGDLLILEVPGHLPFHLAQLGEDDRLNGIVQAAAADALGGRIRLAYRIGAEVAPTAPRAMEPQRAPDKDQMLDAGEAGIDPAGLVVDLLGGEIITDD